MKNKIVFIIISLYGGGAERVVSRMSNALVERGWEVSVIVYLRKEKEYRLSNAIEVIVLPQKSFKLSAFRHISYAISLHNILKKLHPSVVIPFLAIPTIHTFFATRFSKYKVYATIRNNPQRYPDNVWVRWLLNRCIQKMSGVILQTEEQIEFVKNKKETIILHNPVDTLFLESDYYYRDSVEVIATFGRLSKQKNHDLLIKAFSIVASKYPSIQLKIYGEGEEAGHIQCRITELGLGSRIELMGNTTEVQKHMQAADVFVLSSDYEGLPNALIEAMAIGMPCISTKCPTGPCDLIADHSNGLLVPVNDANAVAEAMIEYINSFELRRELGLAAKKTIQNGYEVNKVINRFEQDLIESINE